MGDESTGGVAEHIAAALLNYAKSIDDIVEAGAPTLEMEPLHLPVDAGSERTASAARDAEQMVEELEGLLPPPPAGSDEHVVLVSRSPQPVTSDEHSAVYGLIASPAEPAPPAIPADSIVVTFTGERRSVVMRALSEAPIAIEQPRRIAAPPIKRLELATMRIGALDRGPSPLVFKLAVGIAVASAVITLAVVIWARGVVDSANEPVANLASPVLSRTDSPVSRTDSPLSRTDSPVSGTDTRVDEPAPPPELPASRRARAHRTQVQIAFTSEPPGAEVTYNGRRIGTTPVYANVDAGVEATVWFRGRGLAADWRRITPKQSTTLYVQLQATRARAGR